MTCRLRICGGPRRSPARGGEAAYRLLNDRRPELEDRDRAIIARRLAAFDEELDVRIGDYVDFADGITRRMSHVFPRVYQCSEEAPD